MRYVVFIFAFLGFFLWPYPATAQSSNICVTNRIVTNDICVKSDAADPLAPLVNPLAPDTVKIIPKSSSPRSPAQDKPPKKTTRPNKSKSTKSTKGASRPRQGSSSRPKTSNDGSGASSNPKTTPSPKDKNKDETKTDKNNQDQQDQPENTIVNRYITKGYPWYFWVTLTFTIMSVSLLIFYTTDRQLNRRR